MWNKRQNKEFRWQEFIWIQENISFLYSKQKSNKKINEHKRKKVKDQISFF